MKIHMKWWRWSVLQAAALLTVAGAAMLVVSLAPQPGPLMLHWNPATAEEERAHERKQLSDLLKAQPEANR